jgi:hypothetical protein
LFFLAAQPVFWSRLLSEALYILFRHIKTPQIILIQTHFNITLLRSPESPSGFLPSTHMKLLVYVRVRLFKLHMEWVLHLK